MRITNMQPQQTSKTFKAHCSECTRIVRRITISTQRFNRIFVFLIILACASRVTAEPITDNSIANGPNLPFCEPAKLLAEDGAFFDEFGRSVSVSGDVALVGVYLDDDNGFNSGSAYVFRWNGNAWFQEQKLLTDDGTNVDWFGWSVSISGDVALVGALGDDDNGSSSGSAYVFRWNGSTWIQEQKLLPNDGAADDHFGGSVSVSGDVAMVGALFDNDNGTNSGSAYVFRWNGIAWIQEQKLLSDDGAADDRFGDSVSVSGDVALVGAFLDKDNGTNSGSAYMFRWNGTTWIQEQKILPDDGAAGDLFARSVSVYGDVALVGAFGDDDHGSSSGSAYVFRWNGNAWIQEQKLLANDGAAGDWFGISVSVSGDVALVGAQNDDDNGAESGSAYVFRWNGSTWVQTQKLLANDGLRDDLFGISVSISGDVTLVGASGDDDNGTNSGSAYVFSSSGPDCNLNGVPDRCDIANGISRDLDDDGIPDICTNFCEMTTLLPDDGAAGDLFARSVSVYGDVALVGASKDVDNGLNSGSAYVFRWNGTVWVQEQKLLPDDGAVGNQFGVSVSVYGDVALVGAKGDDDNDVFSGSAYIYRWKGNVWVQEQKLLPDDGAFFDEFGSSVSISGDVALVGAPFDDDLGLNSGSAYVFRWNGNIWVQEQKLLPDDEADGDRFGWSVSASDDVSLVGAKDDDDNGPNSGSAFVFRWNGSAWIQEQKLLADDGATGDNFGHSVSVSGDIALLGAIGDDNNGIGSGSAYVFRWSGSVWMQEQKLLPDDGASGDRFGWSVSVSASDDVSLVGAKGDDDNGTDSGSAYVFRWNKTTWVQQQKILPHDGEADDFFGISLSLYGDVALVGAQFDSFANGTTYGTARVFSIGVTDCNQNDVFDACDIGTGISGDCNDNGTPDDCEVPQAGPVSSTWVDDAGLWDDQLDNVNWCMPESPDNNTDATFDVTIALPGTVVVLNTSPTVRLLTLLNDAVLLVDDQSGANVRTLSVDNCILNTGVFRATDRERLVLDSPIIFQGGACDEGGVLEATDGVLGDGEENDRSVLEINGARVVGGIVRTMGEHSEIHLIGGAELVDVCIDGVVVPDGQTGGFSGTLNNNDVLTIRGINSDTHFGPTAENAVLDSESGNGCVRLTSQAHARLGDFKTTFRNSSTHRIEGAGIIVGGMTNDGVVNANRAGEELIIFPPGQKVNNGLFEASGGGGLRISTAVSGSGAYRAEGGTIRLLPNGGTASIAGATLDISNDEFGNPGVVEVAADASIDISGAVTIGPGGEYRRYPNAQLTSALLNAGSLLITGGPTGTCISAGAMVLEDDMVVDVTRDLTLDGGHCVNSCRCICSSNAIVAVAGGQTPPVKIVVRDRAVVNVSGDLTLVGSVETFYGSDSLLSLEGNFVNELGGTPEAYANAAQCFSWEEGQLLLAGSSDQMIEVSGQDLGRRPQGFESNFAIGTVEVSDSTTVSFVDSFDNDGEGQTSCSEVFYVDELVLGVNATVIVDHCRVYYQSLIDLGAEIVLQGDCAAFVQTPCTNDVNLDLRVDSGDYLSFALCMESSGPDHPALDPACIEFHDVDADGDIDMADWAWFQTLFTGP